jgi:phosphopantetheinyl transferase (holo-ACP synthase)
VAAGDSPTEADAVPALVLEDTWTTGPAVGVGVDVCPWARLERAPARWRGRAERIFSAQEQRDFEGSLAIPWAAREAVLKALGLPSVLGAPLAQMRVERAEEVDGLRYAPTGSALRVLQDRGLRITLRAWQLEEVAIVLALSEEPTSQLSGLCSIRAERVSGDLSVEARRTAQRAAETAANATGVSIQTGKWTGGRDRPPQWGGLPSAQISLSHDQGVVVGAALLPRR